MTALNLRESTRIQLHGRLLDAAQSIMVESGWASITMAQVAHRAGVSRQSVYNEFGNKPDLARELVNRELGRFLAIVRIRMLAHDNVAAGITDAWEGALALAQSSPLLRAALDHAQNSHNDLLALLTTESQGLIDTAVLTLETVIISHYPNNGMPLNELHLAADAIVRLILSHITRPATSPADASTQTGWIASQPLGRR